MKTGAHVIGFQTRWGAINDRGYYRMDTGLDANSWHDDGSCTGSTTRMAWFDEVGWGSTFADADPAQW